MAHRAREPIIDAVVEVLVLGLIFMPALLYGGGSDYFRALFGLWGIVLAIVVLALRVQRGKEKPISHRKLVYPEPWPALVLWSAFLLLLLVQWLPLPAFLAGRLAGDEPAGSWCTLTPYPEATIRTLIAWVPSFAIFAAITLLYRARGQLRRLLWGLFLSAVAISLYGIMETYSGREMIWSLPKQAYLGAVTGTFINRNNFAAYLVLGIGAGLGLGLYRLSRYSAAPQQTGRIEQLVLMAFLGVLCLAGIVLSKSRGGLSSVLLGGLPVVWWFFGRRRPRLFWPVVAGLLLATVALAWWIGREPLAERFTDLPAEIHTADARPTAWAISLKIAVRRPFFGVGAGTFEDQFRVMPDTGVLVRYNHAHSDPLEMLAETGLVGFALFFGAVAWVLFAAGRALRERHSRFARLLAVGAMAGVAAVLFHSLFDFPLQIPGVRHAFFALLAVCYVAANRRLTR